MISILVIMPVLIYAGYSDFKYRIIENKGSLMLIAIGLIEMIFFSQTFSISVSERMIAMLVPALILFIIYVINPSLSGGGDLKLISSMGFCIGFKALNVLLLACIVGIIYCSITKSKTVPMGSAIMIGAGTIVIFYILTI